MSNKVLVVEDNSLNMELMQEILNAMGFTVHGANTGIDAIKKAESESYNLILMDIGLPDIDGIAATKTIKKMSQYKNVPIIALTAYAMNGDKERILDTGFDDYISKPIDVLEFMKRMEKYKNATNLVDRPIRSRDPRWV